MLSPFEIISLLLKKGEMAKCKGIAGLQILLRGPEKYHLGNLTYFVSIKGTTNALQVVKCPANTLRNPC